MFIVTGGAGFIGSAMVRALNDKGIDDILVVDELDTSEKWKNLSNKTFRDYLHKDQFLSLATENKLPQKIEAIFHFGACSSTTETDAEYMMQHNYRWTREASDWAISKNIRFIYASSAATYGEGENGFDDSDESTLRLRPLNVYALSKQLFDIHALKSGAIKKLVGIKFFNVFGPNEYHKGDMSSVVFKAFHQINQTGKLKLFKSYRPEYKDGEQLRDFVYVKDCTAILYWLLENPQVTGIYNIGTGKSRSWNDLGNAVFQAMGKPPVIEYIEMPETLRNKYQYYTEARMDKLRKTGCDVPFRSLEDAVRDYVCEHLVKEFPIW